MALLAKCKTIKSNRIENQMIMLHSEEEVVVVVGEI